MTIHELLEETGRFDTWPAALLWSLARAFKDGTFGEVGFREGGSALAFCIAAREVGGKVYSIDIEPCEEGRERITKHGYSDIHTFIEGDSAVMSFPEQLDILYIDGSHDYTDVRMDYKRHWGSVKRGGLILFHDPVSYPGVGKLLDEEGIPYFRYGAGLGMEVVE